MTNPDLEHCQARARKLEAENENGSRASRMKVCMEFKDKRSTPYRHRTGPRVWRRRLRPGRNDIYRLSEIWNLRKEGGYGHAEGYARIKLYFDGLEFIR